MKWFQGNINEAVAASKTRKAIFVVFVEGKDDVSAQVAGAINNEEVSSRLERDDFVAVRLESGSESYRFFAQIYQLVPIPSLFFIGENGAPLEIVAGNANTAELLSKIDSVLAKVGKTTKDSSNDLIRSEQKASDISSFSKTPETELSSIELDVNKSGPSMAPVPTVSKAAEEARSENPPAETLRPAPKTSSEKLDTPATSETSLEQKNKSDLSAEEKVERARQLIELQKKQREEEERRKERERELERRKMGRDMQKMKQAQQDLEIKQAHDERMREKAAENAARDKVRQQIAQDRLERKQKELALQQQQTAQQQATQEQPKPRTPLSSDSQVVRIQFRLPTGNPHMGQFEPTNTLGALRTYVLENIDLPFRQFALSTSFPRRELTPEDDGRTLLELELVPTAVILILPLRNVKKTSTVSTTVTSTQDISIFSRIMWTVFAPIVSIYNYLMGYFSGPPPRSAGRQGGNTTGSGMSPSNTERPISPLVQAAVLPAGLLRRNIGGQGTTTIRAQGNVHRLHSGGDQDNDENNTWNGNSTQQM